MSEQGPRIAIVHDYLNQRGGAERVVGALHELYPDAPIYTTIVDYQSLWPELKGADIRVTWMQRLPFIKRYYRMYLFFYPLAIESIDLRGYDIIISSSSAFAKGAIKPKGGLHVCYCYTPMRFVWDAKHYLENEGYGHFAKLVFSLLLKAVKSWDLKTSRRPDYYVAISTAIKERIDRFYGLPSEVIFPPVDFARFKVQDTFDDYYLIVSRLHGYKRIELAVEAANRLGVPLKIVGSGPSMKTLKRLAKPNVELLGRLEDEEVTMLYARCKALIFPGIEDFGIAPLEANAAGRPVIAYKAGGALDTVINGVTGYFFDSATPESLMAAMARMETDAGAFNPAVMRAHAMRFDKSVFKERFSAFVAQAYLRSSK